MRFILGGVTFSGESLDEALMVREFEPGGEEQRTNDTDRAQRDGVTPGRDLLGGSTWSWSISARGNNLSDVLAANAELKGAWRPYPRLAPGVKIPLSYLIDGRWRRVYGRPGRYTGPVPDFIAESGIGHIVCDFRVMDPLHYADAESSEVLTIVPASIGGLEAPLMAPLTTVGSGAPRAGFVTNEGDAPTPLKVKFKGPIVDPWVRTSSGMEVGLLGSLAYDQTVTVDPLAGTVLRGSTPVNGMLSGKTRLSTSLLQPGTTELSFGGTDLTGTATATLLWRDAYKSL